MDNIAYDMLYDSILDFRSAAVLVESEIKRHDIRNNSSEPVPGMNGRRHHDMWVSMKAVSHFNLGTALELLLKLLLHINNIPIKKCEPSERHRLTKLYDAMLDHPLLHKQLASTFLEVCRSPSSKRDNFMFKSKESDTEAPLPPPPTRNKTSLRDFFEYLDDDVMIWQKRYQWEHVKDGRWRHYLDDISVPVGVIDSVMQEIPRNEPRLFLRSVIPK